MRNRVNISYQLSRNFNKETLLFVHGLGANLTQFEKQHLFFKEEYQVLSLSLRGHGKTSSLHELKLEDFGLDKMAQDIIELLDKLKINKIHYIGNSMGGNIGYALLKLDESKLFSLITFGTTLELNKSQFLVVVIRVIYKLLPYSALVRLAQYSGVSEYAKKKIHEMFSTTSKKTLLKLLPHLVKFSHLKTIQESNIPLFIIQGERDQEINSLLDEIFLNRGIKDKFYYYKMKNAGHFTNLDNPDRFNLIIKKIVEKLAI